MNIEAVEITEEHTIADFLAPISADNKVGVSLKEDPIYAEIQEARASDDPSLPRGVWEHDLKKSNWDKDTETQKIYRLDEIKNIQLLDTLNSKFWKTQPTPWKKFLKDN